MVNLRMNVEKQVWKKRICDGIREVGREGFERWV